MTSPDIEEQGRRTPPRRGYLVPGAIALVVLAVIAVVVDVTALQSHAPSRLVGAEVEQSIAQWAQAQEGLHNPTATCPAHPPKRIGAVFYCTVTSGGKARRVRVTETTQADYHLGFVGG